MLLCSWYYRSDLNVIIFKNFIFLEIEFDNGNKKEKKRGREPKD